MLSSFCPLFSFSTFSLVLFKLFYFFLIFFFSFFLSGRTISIAWCHFDDERLQQAKYEAKRNDWMVFIGVRNWKRKKITYFTKQQTYNYVALEMVMIIIIILFAFSFSLKDITAVVTKNFVTGTTCETTKESKSVDGTFCLNRERPGIRCKLHCWVFDLIKTKLHFLSEQLALYQLKKHRSWRCNSISSIFPKCG